MALPVLVSSNQGHPHGFTCAGMMLPCQLCRCDERSSNTSATQHGTVSIRISVHYLELLLVSGSGRVYVSLKLFMG